MSVPASAWETAYAFVRKWEGGAKFSNDLHDPGGATRWGVSLRFLQGLPLREGDVDGDGVITWRDVAALPEATARGICRRYFWEPLHGDALPPALAVCLYDTAVNCGRSRAVAWLQQSAAVVAGCELARDGRLGPVTLGCIERIAADGHDRLWAVIERLLELRRRHYRALAGEHGWGERYLRGWLGRTQDLRTLLCSLEASA